jgi:hypothetical protein
MALELVHFHSDIERYARLTETFRLAVSKGGDEYLCRVGFVLLQAQAAIAAEVERHTRDEQPAPYCLWCREDSEHGPLEPWPCPTVKELEPILDALASVLPR